MTFRRFTGLLALGYYPLIAFGCSAADDPRGSPPDAGSDSSSTQPDAAHSPDAAAGDSSSSPSPEAYDPCAAGQCWTAPTVGGLCGTRKISEDFASGLYNVHHYLLLAPAGVAVTLSAQATAGSFSPTLIVHDEAGSTVYDGERGASGAELSIEAQAAEADSARVRVQASSDQHLSLFLSSADVVASGFSASVPPAAEYAFEVLTDCAQSGPLPGPLSVRGVELDVRQELWVRYIAAHVVDELPGTKSERIDKAAYVTWWALKEGVFNVNNPLSYSNCSFPPDEHIGPTEVCPNPDNAWQVGLSGVQAAWRTLADVEMLALQVHPEKSVSQILIGAAAKAGFGAATSIGQQIATSKDRLRLSWLLRDAAVGFRAQYPVVYGECFVSDKPWCFGTGWATSASFAPDRVSSEQSIADLKNIFNAYAQ